MLPLIAVCFCLPGIVYMSVDIFRRVVTAVSLRRVARQNIGKGISLRKDKGARFAYKGICSYFRMEYSKAAAHLEKALAHSYIPQNGVLCLEWLAKCHDAQENHKESLNCLIRAVEVAPSNVKALYNLADRYYRNGLYEKAEFYYGSILKYSENNPLVLYMLGEINMSTERYDEAFERFSRAFETDGEFTCAAAELSVLMALKGEYSKMNDYFENVRKNSYEETGRLEKRLNSIKNMKEFYVQ